MNKQPKSAVRTTVRRVGQLETRTRLKAKRSLSALSTVTGSQSDGGASASKKRRRQVSTPEVNERDGASWTYLRTSEVIADWDELLRDRVAVSWICPVDYFSCAPLAQQWRQFAISKLDTKIELPHPMMPIGDLPVYSVATIKCFAGYKALVRFENVRNCKNRFAWISFCTDIPKPLGYSIKENYLVLPVEELDGANTIDHAKHKKFIDRIFSKGPEPNSLDYEHEETLRTLLADYEKQCNFKLNDMVEVMDKLDPLRNRLATIIAIVGDRIQVKYVDQPENDQGFCFNANSELVHPLGWSHAMGQILDGVPKNSDILPKLPKRAFPRVPPNVNLQVGMVFEVRHPFTPSRIATGVVKRLLKHGYFIALIETNKKEDLAEFVFHVTSQYVLPCGFSAKHNIDLDVPCGEDGSFTWSDYFKKVDARPLIKENVYEDRVHRFVKGCKLEAIDIFEPIYLGPATVLNVAGHLLFIHFDGWSRTKMDTYQWVSAFSGDIYPAGWAELVGHRLQGHPERHQPYDTFYIASAHKNNEPTKD